MSIVIPCRNGASHLDRSLGRLVAFLDRHRDVVGTTEILFVDDGSDDGSADIVRSGYPQVRVLSHEVNRGKGAAVRTGVLAATGRFVFFIDADMPYDLEALPRMLDYLDRKEFHVCVGTRSGARSAAHENRSLARRLASAVFTAFVSRLVVTGVRDTQCGFKGFRTPVAHSLFRQSRIDNFAFDVEILYLAFKNDLDLKRVPVRLLHDENSTVSLLRHALPMLISILLLPLRYYRGDYRVPDQTGDDRP